MPQFNAIFIEWLNTCNTDLILKMSNGPVDGPNGVQSPNHVQSPIYLYSINTGPGDGQDPDNLGFEGGNNSDGYDTMLAPPLTLLQDYPSVLSEVPTGNDDPKCGNHGFNPDEFGDVHHGDKDVHNWYHETQQKYESLDCTYCEQEAITQSVNDKVICNSCDQAAHLEYMPADSSEDPSRSCRD